MTKLHDYLEKIRSEMKSDPVKLARFNAIVQEWGLLHRGDPDWAMERMIQEGLLSRREVRKATRKSMKGYSLATEHQPWSRLQPDALADLMKGDNINETVRRVTDHFEWANNEAKKQVGIRLLGALYLWLRSKHRRLIRVSSKASYLLRKASIDREKQGLSPVEWRERPSPGSPMINEAIMIQWENDPKIMTFMYAEHDQVNYVHWLQIKPEDRYSSWATIATMPLGVDEATILRLNKAKNRPGGVLTSEAKDQIRQSESVDDVMELIQTVPFLNGTYNLVSAMNTAPLFQVLQTSKADNRGRTNLGNVRNVKVCDINLDELARWFEYYVAIKPKGE